MDQWLEGVFYLPPAAKQNLAGIILSCGIHGDETGPINLFQSIMHDLLEGDLLHLRPLLIIFGNPKAIQQNKRYIDFNLNRLFGPTTHSGPEALRAQGLMQACSRFKQLVGKVACHLDFHSTIKPSLIERFALRPVSNNPLDTRWSPTLFNAGFTGLVQQTHSAQTFSQFTHDTLKCESFTLECGSHSKGDAMQNPLHPWLRELIFGSKIFTSSSSTVTGSALKIFLTQEDIIRKSAQFKFLINEHEPNFTHLPAGTEVHSDESGILKLSEERYTLFLNSRVEINQRAGLLLKKI